MSKLNISSLIINEFPCMYLRHKKLSKPKIKFKKIKIFNILFVEIITTFKRNNEFFIDNSIKSWL